MLKAASKVLVVRFQKVGVFILRHLSVAVSRVHATEATD